MLYVEIRVFIVSDFEVSTQNIKSFLTPSKQN